MFILLLHFPFEEFQRSDLLSDWHRLMRWYTKRTPYLEHHKICEWTNACDSLALSELWLAHQIWLCNDNTRIQWININEWNDGRWWWLRVRWMKRKIIAEKKWCYRRENLSNSHEFCHGSDNWMCSLDCHLLHTACVCERSKFPCAKQMSVSQPHPMRDRDRHIAFNRWHEINWMA